MNNGRDCVHGRQVGKCDTCDLIDAEQRILELEAEIEQLRNQVKIPSNSGEAVAMALTGMNWLESNDKSRLTEFHNKYAAEIKAQAIEDALLMVYHEEDDHRGYYSYQGLSAYANQLRQQVKGE